MVKMIGVMVKNAEQICPKKLMGVIVKLTEGRYSARRTNLTLKNLRLNHDSEAEVDE
jgi:hypothetical protein